MQCSVRAIKKLVGNKVRMCEEGSRWCSLEGRGSSKCKKENKASQNGLVKKGNLRSIVVKLLQRQSVLHARLMRSHLKYAVSRLHKFESL